MCTIEEHLAIMESSAYCPACGNSKLGKLVKDDYCQDCASITDTIIITAIPNYTVGYVSDVTSFCP